MKNATDSNWNPHASNTHCLSTDLINWPLVRSPVSKGRHCYSSVWFVLMSQGKTCSKGNLCQCLDSTHIICCLTELQQKLLTGTKFSESPVPQPFRFTHKSCLWKNAFSPLFLSPFRVFLHWAQEKLYKLESPSDMPMHDFIGVAMATVEKFLGLEPMFMYRTRTYVS